MQLSSNKPLKSCTTSTGEKGLFFSYPKNFPFPRKRKKVPHGTCVVVCPGGSTRSPQWPRGKQRLDSCPSRKNNDTAFQCCTFLSGRLADRETTHTTRKHPISPSYPIYRKIAPRHLFGNSAISQTLTNHTQIETALPVVWAMRLKLFRTPSLGEPSDMGIRRCQFGSAKV